jgi:hypothetical protein
VNCPLNPIKVQATSKFARTPVIMLEKMHNLRRDFAFSQSYCFSYQWYPGTTTILNTMGTEY